MMSLVLLLESDEPDGAYSAANPSPSSSTVLCGGRDSREGIREGCDEGASFSGGDLLCLVEEDDIGRGMPPAALAAASGLGDEDGEALAEASREGVD